MSVTNSEQPHGSVSGLLRRLAAVLLESAAAIENVEREISNIVIQAGTAASLQPIIQRKTSKSENPKTTEPARIVLRNPDAANDPDKLLRICRQMGISTKLPTIRGLVSYFRRALTVICDEELAGHDFARNWLKQAPAPRRSLDGVVLSIMEVVLRNNSFDLPQIEKLCRDADIQPKGERTIDGTFEYGHLAWSLVRQEAAGAG